MPDTTQFKASFGAFPNLHAGHSTETERGGNLVHDGLEEDVPVRELVHPPDLGIPGRPVTNKDRTGFREVYTGTEPEQGRLPAAIGTDNRREAGQNIQCIDRKVAVTERTEC